MGIGLYGILFGLIDKFYKICPTISHYMKFIFRKKESIKCPHNYDNLWNPL